MHGVLDLRSDREERAAPVQIEGLIFILNFLLERYNELKHIAYRGDSNKLYVGSVTLSGTTAVGTDCSFTELLLRCCRCLRLILYHVW